MKLCPALKSAYGLDLNNVYTLAENGQGLAEFGDLPLVGFQLCCRLFAASAF
jgi:hypothetical protein